MAFTATRGRKEHTRGKRLDEADTVQGSRSRLDAAARGGMEKLRSAWGSILADHKQVIGPQGCPDEFKQIAHAADAKSALEDSAAAGVDPDTGEVLRPMRSAWHTNELQSLMRLSCARLCYK